jgi:CelD/BcsL family acetyltransferase involved in cellulose biosynthesis
MRFGRNGARLALTTTEYPSVDALPSDAVALFGADFFATVSWYRTVVAHALPPDTRAVFLTLSDPNGVVAVFPMAIAGRSAMALTTPYTCEWRPLLAPALSLSARASVWRRFGAWCAGFATVRLDAMDRAVADSIARGVAACGVIPLPFDHFGNWCQTVDSGWSLYLQARPGHVREVLRRRSKRLAQSGAAFTVIAEAAEVERGIAAFERAYATSWKTPEPYPMFNPALMRSCAAEGSLRLGMLAQGNAILAVQFWVVAGRWSAVLKLAHDEAARALSPGTILTARMIEYLITADGITEIDFGRGDDPYKQSWTSTRRQRVGLELANPLRASGLLSIGRHLGGKALRELRRRKIGWGVAPPPNPPSPIGPRFND